MNEWEWMKRLESMRAEGMRQVLKRHAKTNGKFLTRKEFEGCRMECHAINGNYLKLRNEVRKMFL